ncbi:MAG: hypothetical protein GY930_11315 [bacterium]|nr:hypothetical protein [bacterium]
MNDNESLDSELGRLVDRLPEILRDDWVVMPKHSINQACAVSFMLGVALALMIAGYALDITALKWVWPLVFLSLLLATKMWPWWRGDRFADQLRRASRSESA